MSKADDFSFPIPYTELEKGIKLSIENAERLIEDAETLCKNGRYPSASYLAIVALEEEGKAYLLLKRFIAKTDIKKKSWRDDFWRHEKKIIAVQEAISKYRKLKINGKQVRLEDLAKFFLDHKDDCLYVDWDFEKNKTQITDKWKYPLKDVIFDGFPSVDDNKRCKTAEDLIYEAKLGLEATKLILTDNTP